MNPISEEIQAFIQAHREVAPASLALMAQKYPDWDMPWIASQVAGWQAARYKLPSWAAQTNLLYPPRVSMEQCSSELTAQFKAGLFQGEKMADLTGGWGVDSYFFSKYFDTVHYMERAVELAAIAQHNFPTLGAHNIEVHQGDSISILEELEGLGLIYLDPARRDSQQRKVVGFEDCEPNLLAIKEQLLQKAPQVLVKASPMIDIKLAIRQLESVHQVWVVGVENECKEVLFLLRNDEAAEIAITAVDLKKDGTSQVYASSYEQEENSEMLLSAPLAFLYEPHAALMKAGLFKSMPLAKLHPHSHLYTSKELQENFPGRSFIVEGVFPFQKKLFKRYLPPKANLAVRNFPLSVADIRKRTGLKEGGDVYLFATTLLNGDKVVVKCRKV